MRLERDTAMKNTYIPEVTGNLRKNYIKVPEIIAEECSGIKIFGKHIKSFIFTTDAAIIKNTNADAVMAVYPFTPQLAITQAILSISDLPVVCGVGGGLTNGKRSANVALHAEFQGAMGVVLNEPAPSDTISYIKSHIDIPVIATIVSKDSDFKAKIEAGADIINVSGGKDTAEIVKVVRAAYPHLPIIATGGHTDETIRSTIEAGANCITYTPPNTSEIIKALMKGYRMS